MEKKFTLAMPTVASLVSKFRSGVRPGQVFRDKRRKARVNQKSALRKQGREE
jgi:hypothetical protein